MALVQLEPGARARAWFKNDRPSLAIAHHAGLSQMTGTRNDFSATQPWAHHLGTLKSVGNATSCLISTSCLCRMGTGHACAPLKVAAEHEKLSVGNVTPHPKRVGLPAPRMRWSRPTPRSGLQPESGQQHTSKAARAAHTLGVGHARATCMSPQQRYNTIAQFKPSLAKRCKLPTAMTKCLLSHL